MPPKKKKQRTLFHDNETILSGLRAKYKGQRVLLKSVAIWKHARYIPDGEEDYLYQYHIEDINSDCKTATIEFDQCYVIEGENKFCNYFSPDNNIIDSYSLELFADDHDLYNEYLGRENKVINDKKDALMKEQQSQKVKASEDVSDIAAKFQSKISHFEILKAEFEPAGSLMEHTVKSGPNRGKMNYKQQWRHKHSGYTFIWHRLYGKTSFVTDRLWKTVPVIVLRNSPGSERLKLIMKYSKKSLDSSEETAKYPRDVDMVNRVAAVFGGVGAKVPLAVFDNWFMKDYINGLDPKHSVPYRLERCRIMEVMIDKAKMELYDIAMVSR